MLRPTVVCGLCYAVAEDQPGGVLGFREISNPDFFLVGVVLHVTCGNSVGGAFFAGRF